MCLREVKYDVTASPGLQKVTMKDDQDLLTRLFQ